MATYNGEEFLLEQLRSILAQTRIPDEVIICDDCSADQTVDILQNFIETNGLSNWFVFENQENVGYLKNFREAMTRAAGDIVFLCDQDDVWENEKIALMVSEMERNPSILALACNYRLIDGDGDPLESSTRKYYNPPRKKTSDAISLVKSGKMLYYNIAQGCACAYRRKLVDMYCAVEECWILPHDWALNLLAYQEQGMYFLDRELLLYRIHGKNRFGISSSWQVIYNRIPRLLDYAKTIGDAVELPIPEETREEIRTLVEFTYVRIRWLREKRLSTWIGGFFRYFATIREYFFFAYAKDFLLVILGRTPKEDDQGIGQCDCSDCQSESAGDLA